MADSFSITSKRGWGSRLKNSFVGILIGIVLVAGSCLGLWLNEGRAVKRYQDLSYGRDNCVSVGSDAVLAQNKGKLVHITGSSSPGSTPSDPDFGVTADGAIKLQRGVEMYQWKEKSSGGSEKKTVGGGTTSTRTYTYEKEWSSQLEKSGDFENPTGHDNPQSMRFSGQISIGAPVMVGAFTLSETLLNKLSDFQPMAISSLESLAEIVRNEAKLQDGQLYFGSDPAAPNVGDLRVSFSQVPAGEISVIAEQNNAILTPHQAENNALAELQTGTHTVEAMFAKAESANKMLTWAFRVAGFVAMLIGLNLLTKPLVVIADFLPFVGNIVGAGLGFVMALLAAVISFAVIAVAWLAYRPLLGFGLLAAAGLLIFLVVKKSRAASHSPQSAPPSLPSSPPPLT